ncbi:MAG TPA: hypothetical protein VM123_09625 [archaeon]|nr:hypothetical protein [archaeon]
MSCPVTFTRKMFCLFLSILSVFVFSGVLLGHDEDFDLSGGIWRSSITAGTILSQERDNLSKWRLLLKYEGNTLLKRTQASRVHSFFNIGLTQVPQEIDLSRADGSSVDKFITSRKSLSTDLGLYWIKEFKSYDDDVLNLGPIVNFGLENVLSTKEAVVDNDSVNIGTQNNFFISGGLRFSHHKECEDNLNPKLLQSIDILLGYHAQFLAEGVIGDKVVSTKGRGRMIIDAYSKLVSIFYLGFNANFPISFKVRNINGDPNIRLWFACRW